MLMLVMPKKMAISKLMNKTSYLDLLLIHGSINHMRKWILYDIEWENLCLPLTSLRE